MSKQIQLWLDATSDPDAPAWCVSLCDADHGDGKCLATYALDDRADAWAEAKECAQRRNIPAVEIDAHGKEVRRWECSDTWPATH